MRLFVKDFAVKRYERLGLICLLYMATSAIFYFTTDNFIFRWLAVNLFLACIPLVFSTLAQMARQRGKRIMHITAIVLCLMFFPNAPYMVTDFIHISYLGFDSYFVVVKDVFAWFGLVYMVIGIVLGILVGLLSLDDIVQPLFDVKRRGLAVSAVAAVSLASGYAIYIGRFLRFNSWDLFYPVELINRLAQDWSLFTVSYSLLMAGFVAFGYLMFCVLKKLLGG